MAGSDDRRSRPPAAGAQPAAPWPASGSEPVEGAPGWRVTRRAVSPAVGAASVPWRPQTTAAVGERPIEPPAALPGQTGVIGRAPRRVAGPAPPRRGISLLALAAAAVVVVCVLGLAVLDMQGVDWPSAWPEQPAMIGNAGKAAAGAPAGRPG